MIFIIIKIYKEYIISIVMIFIFGVYFLSLWSLVGLVYGYHNKLFYFKGDVIKIKNNDNQIIKKYNNMLKKYNYMLENMSINIDTLVTTYEYGIILQKSDNIPFEIISQALDTILVKNNITDISMMDKLNLIENEGIIHFIKDNFGFFADKNNIIIYKQLELKNKINEYLSNGFDLVFYKEDNIDENSIIVVDINNARVLDSNIITTDTDKLVYLLQGKVCYNVINSGKSHDAYTFECDGIHNFISKSLLL
jgi:hypothetical protein